MYVDALAFVRPYLLWSADKRVYTSANACIECPKPEVQMIR